MRRSLVAVSAALILVAVPAVAAAESIPPTVSVSAFVGPDGTTRWAQPFEVSGYDGESGIDRLELFVNGITIATWEDDGASGELVRRSFTPTTAAPPDGPIEIAARATDKEGNTDIEKRTLTLDATRPVLDVLGASVPAPHTKPWDYITDQGTFTLRFRPSDAHLDPTKVRCFYDNGEVPCPVDPAGVATFSAPTGAPGTHFLGISAMDRAQNHTGRSIRIFVDDGPARVTQSGGTPEGARLLPLSWMKPGRELLSVGWDYVVDELGGVQFQCRSWYDGQPEPVDDFDSCGAWNPRPKYTVADQFAAGRWTVDVRAIDIAGHVTPLPPHRFTVTAVPGMRFMRPTTLAVFVADGAERRARIRVTKLPAGARAELRCDGRKCPFERLRIPVRRGRADATALLRKKRFAVGQEVELRLTAPKRVGRVVLWTLGGDGTTQRHDLCLAPGASTPRGCWD